MAADWLKIKTEYINDPDTSYRKLAEKHGVNKDTIAQKAKAEGWADKRRIQADKTHTKTIQKTAEKISDNESEVAAIKSRLKRMIFEQIEQRMAGELDGADFRRIVQSYKDMCEIKDESGLPNDMVNEDGLSRSLREIGKELECDGD